MRRGDDIVPVEPQVFDLLAFLVRNRDRVLSKDDLIAAIWNGRIVSVSAIARRPKISGLVRAMKGFAREAGN